MLVLCCWKTRMLLVGDLKKKIWLLPVSDVKKKKGRLLDIKDVEKTEC